MEKKISGISQIADQFDAFIIDLWGVLHDGTAPYPGAVNALSKLREAGKRIVLLSNAPRAASKAADVLGNLGFSDDLYDAVITSGQAVRDHLDAHRHDGTRYYYIGPAKDEDILDGLDYTRVDAAEDADFAIVTGFDEGETLADRQHELDACLAAKLPLICANPDKIVVKQTGEELLCAGVIADAYKAMGGEVSYFGKPYPAVYHACYEQLEVVDPSRTCAIGDSLETDIAGATSMAINAVLVTGGILARDLGVAPGDEADLDKLAELEAAYDAVADQVIPRFVW